MSDFEVTQEVMTAPPTLEIPIEDQTVQENTENYILEISGNFNPLGEATYTATGLPYGLTIDSETGVISGMPQDSSSLGTNIVEVTVTNSEGSVQDSFELEVTKDNRGSSLINGLADFPNRILGRDGNDTIEGSNITDLLRGNSEDDLLIGGNGRDTLYGGSGFDALLGEKAKDLLIGNAQEDILRGGSQDDTLRGGLGNDSLFGDEGSDFVFGGPGKDLLVGINPSRSNPGVGEIDILTGGADRDNHILGNKNGVFYSEKGNADYALIQGFSQIEDDRFQLFGTPDDYLLADATNYLPISGLAIVEASTDELIGVIQGEITGLQLDSKYFTYSNPDVQSLTLESDLLSKASSHPYGFLLADIADALL